MFSMVRNIKNIFSVREDGDPGLNIFNGVRVISMCWIVYGHEYNARMRIATNLASIEDTLSSNWTVFVLAGVYSVDIFFFMSGFFFSYIFLGKLNKLRFNIVTYIQTIIHRVYRILPLYAMILLLMYRVLPFVGSGPMWNDFI